MRRQHAALVKSGLALMGPDLLVEDEVDGTAGVIPTAVFRPSTSKMLSKTDPFSSV